MTIPVATLEPAIAVCSCCGGLVTHVRVSKHAWESLPHDAPCGRPCVAGGVSAPAYLLGSLHRHDECEACEETFDAVQ